MPKPIHLISYLLHNEQHTVEVEADNDDEVLTPEQARLRLNAIHTFEWPNEITDIRVTRISHPKKGTPSPAHHLPG